LALRPSAASRSSSPESPSVPAEFASAASG
jgi:hypothetical protein